MRLQYLLHSWSQDFTYQVRIIRNVINFKGLNEFLELAPLKGVDWLVVVIGIVIQFTLVELLKLAGRRYRARL